MAIPHHATIVCPSCGASEEVIIADTSEGPNGRTAPHPVLSLLPGPLWSQTTTQGETWLSCATCGRQNFASLSALAAEAL